MTGYAAALRHLRRDAAPTPIRRRLERGELSKLPVSPEDVRVEEIGPGELAAFDPDGLMFVNVNTPHDYERAKNVIDRMPEATRRCGSYHGC